MLEHETGLVDFASPVNQEEDVDCPAARGCGGFQASPLPVSVSGPLYIGPFIYIPIIIIYSLNHVRYIGAGKTGICYLAGYPACQINTVNPICVFSVLLRFKYFSIIPP